MEAKKDASIPINYFRVTKGELDYLGELMEMTGLFDDGLYHVRRLFLTHLVRCQTELAYKYGDDGVPVPSYAIRGLPGASNITRTRRVWWPLVEAGIIGYRKHSYTDDGRGESRVFWVWNSILRKFNRRGTEDLDRKTRYNAFKYDRSNKGQTTAKYQTKLTYDGQHSWGERSALIYDVLSYFKHHGRGLINKASFLSHLGQLRQAAEEARQKAKDATYPGPSNRAALARWKALQRAAEKAEAQYDHEARCWEAIQQQNLRPAKDMPEGIYEFTLAYRVQRKSGRLTCMGGGIQNLSGAGKAASYEGIPRLVNYDIKSSQTSILVEEFTYAISCGADLNIDVLTEYAGKDALAEEYGVHRKVFKIAEHAPKFGAGFRFKTFQTAWNSARHEAFEKLKKHGWGSGPSKYRSFDERTVAELDTMPRLAYEIACDEEVTEISDAKAAYELLRRVYRPMAEEIAKWREWLVAEHWRLHSKKDGGHGGFIENPCGLAFRLCDHLPKNRDKEYATTLLQGKEAAFVHHLTLLGHKYGFEVIANEHDGIVCIGTIPEAAVREARRLADFPSAEIEPKQFTDGSSVGLPVDDVMHAEDTEPCVSSPTTAAMDGASTDFCDDEASSTRLATAKTGSTSPAGRAASPSGARRNPRRRSSSTATSSMSSRRAASRSSTTSSPSGMTDTAPKTPPWTRSSGPTTSDTSAKDEEGRALFEEWDRRW